MEGMAYITGIFSVIIMSLSDTTDMTSLNLGLDIPNDILFVCLPIVEVV